MYIPSYTGTNAAWRVVNAQNSQYSFLVNFILYNVKAKALSESLVKASSADFGSKSSRTVALYTVVVSLIPTEKAKDLHIKIKHTLWLDICRR